MVVYLVNIYKPRIFNRLKKFCWSTVKFGHPFNENAKLI